MDANEALMMPAAMKILVIDDSHPTQIWLKESLAPDFELITADSCSDAWKILNHTPIALVLIEELLPDHQGTEFTQQLKNHPKFKDLPAIMISGLNPEAVMERAFERGAVDFIAKPINLFELKARIHRVLRQSAYSQRIKQSLSQLKERSEKDSLTQIYNREAFFEYARREVAKCLRTYHPLSLLIVDIDKFKDINDHYGHLAGDKVLRQFADVLVRNTRDYDMVGRYGGDEFVILLTDVTQQQALRVGEKILASMEATPFYYKESKLKVTPSIGVVSFDQIDPKALAEGQGLEAMLEMADKALYQAKEAGRNRLAQAR